MMSDEEESGDTYIRHQPSYRSELLNNFILKLDSRCDAAKNTQPRKKRVIGSPVKKPVPRKAKNWVLKPEFKKGHDSAHSKDLSNEHDSSAQPGGEQPRSERDSPEQPRDLLNASDSEQPGEHDSTADLLNTTALPGDILNGRDFFDEQGYQSGDSFEY